MGLFDRLRNELIDIIEWIDDSNHTLVWRFPRFNNEIKNGAQLIVRPGQQAILVNEGQIADVYGPGRYVLSTQNMPILSTLMGWKYGFESPFKCEVYFVSTRQITDLKWGTPNPILLRDPEFGPIRVRAFGTYSLQAVDAKALLTEVVGTDSNFQTDEITELIRSMITSAFSEAVAELQISALDLAQRYSEVAKTVQEKVVEQIDDEYGLNLPKLVVVNVSLPEEVEKAVDTRTSMGVIGDMNRYQQFQMGNAMTLAAENTAGGGAAEGMGLGVGLAMANRMVPGGMMGGVGAGGGAAMGGAAMGGAAMGGAAPPPPPGAWHVAVDGQTQGPFGMQQLAGGISSGQVSPETMVWTAGMQGWQAAGTVPALAQLFSSQAAPPPPPPAS